MHVCGYAMRHATYDFNVFEYHTETYTHLYLRYAPYFPLDFDIFRVRTRRRAYGFIALHNVIKISVLIDIDGNMLLSKISGNNILN